MPASRFAAWAAGVLLKSGATDATEPPIPSSSKVRDVSEAVAHGERSDATGATDLIPGGRAANEAADATAWLKLYSERADHHEVGSKRPRVEAERLAYGDLLSRWHMAHGRRWPAWQCAGCGAPIGRLSALALPDDARVHFDHQLDCLTGYGKRWRGAAIAALCVFGIKTPQRFEE
jgi:hypothetical protein